MANANAFIEDILTSNSMFSQSDTESSAQLFQLWGHDDDQCQNQAGTDSCDHHHDHEEHSKPAKRAPRRKRASANYSPIYRHTLNFIGYTATVLIIITILMTTFYVCWMVPAKQLRTTAWEAAYSKQYTQYMTERNTLVLRLMDEGEDVEALGKAGRLPRAMKPLSRVSAPERTLGEDICDGFSLSPSADPAQWPLEQSTQWAPVLYCLLLFMTFVSHLATHVTGPGYVSKDWSPEAHGLNKEKLQYCKICDAHKPARAHHCRRCGRCVLKMDHHCPFVGTCVGHHNHKPFMAFVFYAPLASLVSFVLLVRSVFVHRIASAVLMLLGSMCEEVLTMAKGSEFIHELKEFIPAAYFNLQPGTLYLQFREHFVPSLPLLETETAIELLQSWSLFAAVFSILLAAIVTVLVGLILHDQCLAVMENMTFLETKVHDRAVLDRMEGSSQSKKKKNKKWVWPYDLSMINDNECTMAGVFRNVKSVMGRNILLWFVPTTVRGLEKSERDSAGVIWPLGPRAKQHKITQYTLPLEERAQAESREEEKEEDSNSALDQQQISEMDRHIKDASCVRHRIKHNKKKRHKLMKQQSSTPAA